MVTYNGKPVTNGSVMFTPAGGKGGETGQGAVGQLESDGSFTLTTFDKGDGALLGEHVVTVEALGVSGTDISKSATKPDGTINYVLPKQTIPEKYQGAGTSPLRFTVKEGSNTANLELKD
ncbi:MAG: hypothetical protein LC745_12580 [Planctomycetia bacterium]|nr:hypothetical protein [Planctomycetia bacterium]